MPENFNHMSESSSAFIEPADFSAEWRDITLVQQRKHTCIYTATRYGRRFLLKALVPEYRDLTDHRLQQEQEFQLGIQPVHPNIAAVYALEDVPEVGRCIVQEWVDGITLAEWLQIGPSSAARERVFTQLLDALEYIHGRQLVHHDLKADNILITRNGANVKLIDFGLSATDSTLSPVPNDPREDIRSLGRILPLLLPRQRKLARQCSEGRFPNIGALRQVISRRQRFRGLFPVLLSVILFIVASALFYLSWHERHEQQQRHEAMIAMVDKHLSSEREQFVELLNSASYFDSKNATDLIAYNAYVNRYTAIRQHYWAIRDSVVATFDENDPLREQCFQAWTLRETHLDEEFYPQICSKLQ